MFKNEELLEKQLFYNAPREKPKCRNLSIEELLRPQPFYKQPIKKPKRKRKKLNKSKIF